MTILNLETFGRKLEEEIFAFSHMSRATISGLIWEERIFNALLIMDLEPKWKMGSHNSGMDIEVCDYKFSAKSQRIKNKTFDFSSFRTTEFEELEDKLCFIDGDGKNFTHYLILSKKELKNIIIYRIFLIEADFIQASNFTWYETFGKRKKNIGKPTGWATNIENGIQLKISKKMSDQLWICIDKDKMLNQDKVELLGSVEIDRKDIGSKWIDYKEQVFNGT